MAKGIGKMKTIVVCNNKGGVGKTTILFQITDQVNPIATLPKAFHLYLGLGFQPILSDDHHPFLPMHWI